MTHALSNTFVDSLTFPSRQISDSFALSVNPFRFRFSFPSILDTYTDQPSIYPSIHPSILLLLITNATILDNDETSITTTPSGNQIGLGNTVRTLIRFNPCIKRYLHAILLMFVRINSSFIAFVSIHRDTRKIQDTSLPFPQHLHSIAFHLQTVIHSSTVQF